MRTTSGPWRFRPSNPSWQPGRGVLVRSFCGDVSTRERIGTLEGAGGYGYAVAFSPEGDLLASPRGLAIQLWDVRNRELIDTFEGHTHEVYSVAFSTDGALLASGSYDRTVRVWDVGSRKEIATLEGHAAQINAVAFSPDGTLLASASGDSWKTDEATVRLWNVESRVELSTPERTRGAVEQVAFSPDGKRLIWSSWPAAQVTMWDVESREPIATFEGSSFALSPDGAILACFSGTITLWEAGTGSQIVNLPDAFHSSMLSFSPDGAILAAGSWSYGTITLWDVSEWTGPRPFALEIVSGDEQRGTPGAALAEPLVVEVRDQYGGLLPDAAVTFTVTAGEGQLSGRFTVEHATTDANGRAELPLTLGPHSGPNIVGVSIGERELATFTAKGVGTAVAVQEGDYRTWHLPRAATVRLGKGALGESDRAVALSADGRCLAVASALGVWLYEAATSRALALLPTESPVHSVAFSLHGTLAAGLDNGQVELWEVETGERIGTLRHADWGGGRGGFFSGWDSPGFRVIGTGHQGVGCRDQARGGHLGGVAGQRFSLEHLGGLFAGWGEAGIGVSGWHGQAVGHSDTDGVGHAGRTYGSGHIGVVFARWRLAGFGRGVE